MSEVRGKNKAEKAHLNAVAALGCVVCRNQGMGATPAEIHHIRNKVGMGNRASHFQVIPLCHSHHRTGGFGIAFHAGKTLWQANFGAELELLEQTQKELGMP